MEKKRRKISGSSRNYVTVKNRSYGAPLQGIKIYFEGGKRPKILNKDGSVKFGKHILEILRPQFERFRWVITDNVDSIRTERGIVRVRTSVGLLNRMFKEEWARTREIKNDIVRRFFGSTFPEYFSDAAVPSYASGTLGRMLDQSILPRLSSEDRQALNRFIPEFVASESLGTISLLKATAEIETLRGLSDNFQQELSRDHGEAWWQTYIKSNILLMQQGYIKAIEKLNVAIGGTKFPDFSLVTHDNYLDILEIKTPTTATLRFDKSRGNYFWDAEIGKAISQVENYIANVERYSDSIRSYLQDEYKITIKAVRPRGILLVGHTRQFVDQKAKDDFRLMSLGIKNISIVTYDELLARLRNYIGVLEEFSKGLPKVTTDGKIREK